LETLGGSGYFPKFIGIFIVTRYISGEIFMKVRSVLQPNYGKMPISQF